MSARPSPTPDCLRAALDVLPDAALQCCLGGEIAAANDLAASMFGTPVDEMVGRRVDRWLEVENVLADLSDAGHGVPRGVDLAARRSDGAPFVVRASVQLRSRAGNTTAVWILRESADTPATVAARFFDVGFDRAPIGMALFNLDGEYVRVNGALCRTLGRREPDLVGRRDQELTHPDDRHSDLAAAEEIFAGRRDTHRCEKRFVRPDGSVVWTIANLTFLRDEAGRPLLWVGQFQDITARRTAEEAERRARELSQLIIDSIADGVVLTRGERIAAVNDALCRLTGFTRDELVGAGPPYPFRPDAPREGIRPLRGGILEQDGGEVELTLVRKDGGQFPASFVTARAAGQAGPPAYVTTIRDISARKRYEDELHRRATRDGLTGLLNRDAFEQRMAAEIAAARASGRSLTLAILDLDHFKDINDRHGHPAGDRVLVATAERLRAVSRTGDHLARVGGEEFAWLFTDADGDAAFLAAERARRAVEEAVSAGGDIVTMSVGVCELRLARDGDDLYRLADAALYRAKALGRNLCIRYSPDPDPSDRVDLARVSPDRRD